LRPGKLQQLVRELQEDVLVTSAVVPVAGLGTRMLPATKSQPKEMLPVGKKPIVQYVVEELVTCGIEQILFVTGKNKNSIENHFDFDHELMRSLRETGKEELVAELEFERMRAHFFYTRQRRQRGLGDAVLCAERFAGSEPFVVALGDSILGLHANSSCVRRMIEAHQAEPAAAIIAVEEVAPESLPHYGVVKPSGEGELFEITDLVEKPEPAAAPSRLAIAGRYLFSPEIFDTIRETKPDRRGEIQLTDAIRILRCRGKRVMGLRLPPGERRYDIGNFQAYFETFVEFALADPEYAPGLRRHIEKLLSCN
jgi:UTP--glucose-1-phosphate uridylyltransferase